MVPKLDLGLLSTCVLLMLDHSLIVLAILTKLRISWLQRSSSLIAHQSSPRVDILLLIFVLGRCRLWNIECCVRFNLSLILIQHCWLCRIIETWVVWLLGWEVAWAWGWLHIVARMHHHIIAGFRWQFPLIVDVLWRPIIFLLTVKVQIRVGHYCRLPSIKIFIVFRLCSLWTCHTWLLVPLSFRPLQHLEQTTFLNPYLLTELFKYFLEFQNLFDWTSRNFLLVSILLRLSRLSSLPLRSLAFWWFGLHHGHQRLHQVSFTLLLSFLRLH